jgi:integrase
LRDQFGVLVRESFKPGQDDPSYLWPRGWERSFGAYLETARQWARDRIAIHQGEPTSEDLRIRSWDVRKRRILSTSLGKAFDQRIAELRKRSRNHSYVDHLDMLVHQHIPIDIRELTFANIPVSELADSITRPSISYGNVKVLRAFVGGVFKAASKDYGPLHGELEALQERCLANLEARTEPPYPAILNITSDDYLRFFALIEEDKAWRQALAIRLYFATGAKMQQVLAARWSDIVDGTWYPFTPNDRKLWYESRERLSEDAQGVMDLVAACHAKEGLQSPYLFPSKDDAQKPITSIQRHWSRFSGVMRWAKLPISHVVLRHRRRTNPSYSLEFIRYYFNFHKDTDGRVAVSKVGKRRRDKSINSKTYR